MRGAPQLGFSATIRKISSRTSLLVGFLPTAFRAREIQRQYSRNPARCQRTTISGVTRINDFFQPEQTCRKTTRTAGRRNSVEGEVAWRAEPGVIAEGRGSPGEFFSRAHDGEDPAEQMSKAPKRQVIIAKGAPRRFASKSLILRTRRVLARHSHFLLYRRRYLRNLTSSPFACSLSGFNSTDRAYAIRASWISFVAS